MLRLKGPEVYDQWVNHEIPFDDPDVVEVGRVRLRHVGDRGHGLRRPAEHRGHAVRRRRACPLLEGKCEMHRQGNFYAANWPEGTELGPDGDVNAFYLPDLRRPGLGQVTLSRWHLRRGVRRPARGDGDDASSSPAPTTPMPGRRWAASCRPTRTSTPSLYPTEIEQNFAEILANGRPGPLRRQRPDAGRRGRGHLLERGGRHHDRGADGGRGLHGRRGELALQLAPSRARHPPAGRLKPAGGWHRTPIPHTDTDLERGAMGQLVSTFFGVVVAVAVTLGVFVLLNAVVDLAPKHFTGLRHHRRRARRLGRRGARQQRRLVPRRAAVAARAASCSAPLVGLLRVGHPAAAAPSAAGGSPSGWRPVVFLAPGALVPVRRRWWCPTIRTVYLSFRSRRGDEPAGIENYRDRSSATRTCSASTGSATSSPAACSSSPWSWRSCGLACALLPGPDRRPGARRSAAPDAGRSRSAPPPSSCVLAMMGALSGVIWNNLFWVVFVTGLATIIGLAIAVLADRTAGESVAKSLIFMPMAISFVGASVIWRFVYAFTPAGERPDRPAQRRVGRRGRRAPGVDPADARGTPCS